jgi:hypothetical protein
MVDHVKRTWKVGCVYTMPTSSFDFGALGAGAAQLTRLRSKQTRGDWAPIGEAQLEQFLLSTALAGLGAFGDDELDCTDVGMDGGETRSLTFSIVDPRPSRARVIPVPSGAADRLGPDDIQIAIHTQPSTGSSQIISVGVQEVASNPIMVLSRLGTVIAGVQVTRVPFVRPFFPSPLTFVNRAHLDNFPVTPIADLLAPLTKTNRIFQRGMFWLSFGMLAFVWHVGSRAFTSLVL